MPLLRPGPMLLRTAGVTLPAAPTPADVFATSTYTGNVTARTITNSINMSANGGMVWIKTRSSIGSHYLMDTVRGPNSGIAMDNTSGPSVSSSNFLSAFGTSGFSMNPGIAVNVNGTTYVAWAFREAVRFFDIVSYTGDGDSTQLNHNLAVTPGHIIIIRTDGSQGLGRVSWVNWDAIQDNYVLRDTTGNAESGGEDVIFGVNEESFYIGSNDDVNASGGTYVAYVFANDTNSDGIIKCGTYTGNGSTSGPTQTLGWNPRFVNIKRLDGNGSWAFFDSTRGIPSGSEAYLQHSNAAETATVDYIDTTGTGFRPAVNNSTVNGSGFDYWYMAIK